MLSRRRHTGSLFQRTLHVDSTNSGKARPPRKSSWMTLERVALEKSSLSQASVFTECFTLENSLVRLAGRQTDRITIALQFNRRAETLVQIGKFTRFSGVFANYRTSHNIFKPDSRVSFYDVPSSCSFSLVNRFSARFVRAVFQT